MHLILLILWNINEEKIDSIYAFEETNTFELLVSDSCWYIPSIPVGWKFMIWQDFLKLS